MSIGPAPSIYEVSGAFDTLLRARESQAMTAVASAFSSGLSFIEGELQANGSVRGLAQVAASDPTAIDRIYQAGLITDREVRRAKRGTGLGPSWEYQDHRLRAMKDAFARQQSYYLGQAGSAVHRELLSAETLGHRYGATVADFGLLSAGTAPVGLHDTAGTAAIRAMTGAFSPDSPLARLFEDIAVTSSDNIKRELIRSAAVGLSPRAIAGNIADAIGGDLARGLTIARTEVLRGYREGTRAAWAGNPLVDQWEWRSARDETTCAVCWSMDSRYFPTSEPMATHPNCRCTMLPVLPGLASIEADQMLTAGTLTDLKGLRQQRAAEAEALGLRHRSGDSLVAFRSLTDAAQRAIMGKTRHEAWKAGKVTLGNMVSIPKSGGEWGRVPTLRTLETLGLAPGSPPRAPRPKPKPKPAPAGLLQGAPKGWDPSTNPYTDSPDAQTLIDTAPDVPPGRPTITELGMHSMGQTAGEAKHNIANDLATRMKPHDGLLADIADFPSDFNPAFLVSTAARYNISLPRTWLAMSKQERLAHLSGVFGHEFRQHVASVFINQWAYTSADSSTGSLLMQMAAERALGVAAPLKSHFAREAPTQYREAQALLATPLGRYMVEFVKASHAATQAWLGKTGLKTVRLYRGQTNRPDGYPPGASGPRQLTGHFQPMSSWSISKYTAKGFGKYVFSVEVPISWVAGSAKTGWGCLSEGELVLAGGKYDVFVERL